MNTVQVQIEYSDNLAARLATVPYFKTPVDFFDNNTTTNDVISQALVQFQNDLIANGPADVVALMNGTRSIRTITTPVLTGLFPLISNDPTGYYNILSGNNTSNKMKSFADISYFVITISYLDSTDNIIPGLTFCQIIFYNT